jgi:YbbR domain-containing protein
VRAAVPPTATPPRWPLAVGPSDVEVPRNAKVVIQDVEPREVEVELDRLVRRAVPVAFRGVVEAESGFALSGRLAVEPSSVEVIGPRALVAGLDSVRTTLTELRGLTATTEQRVPLDTTASAALRISPAVVTVRARVRRS